MKSLFRQNLKYCSTMRQTGKPVVGFVGLGNMGGPMAKNLLKNNFKVNIFDLKQSAVEDVQKSGGVPASDVQTLVQKSDVVITMLTSNKVCDDIFNNIVFKNAKPNTLAIDCSTISPSLAKSLYENGAKNKVRFVDAPVSGGVTGAAAGTLTFMVGSPDAQVFSEVQSILTPMGKNIINCQKPGAGQIAKACNNLALSIEMLAVAEALSLGKQLGIDVKVLADIMKTATSRCWSIDTYPPAPGLNENVPSSRDYNGGFQSALMLKDLTIANSAAEEVGAKLIGGKKTKEIYEELVKKGYGEKDFSIVYQYILNNLK